MAALTFNYTTCNRLSCSSVIPSDLIICVDPSLTTSGDGYIEGTLIASCKSKTSCNTWVYTITIEGTDLITPDEFLSSLITGIVCKGCLTTYIDNKVSGAGGVVSAYPGEWQDSEFLPEGLTLSALSFAKWRLTGLNTIEINYFFSFTAGSEGTVLEVGYPVIGLTNTQWDIAEALSHVCWGQALSSWLKVDALYLPSIANTDWARILFVGTTNPSWTIGQFVDIGISGTIHFGCASE
jgi:hypothetical protein